MSKSSEILVPRDGTRVQIHGEGCLAKLGPSQPVDDSQYVEEKVFLKVQTNDLGMLNDDKLKVKCY